MTGATGATGPSGASAITIVVGAAAAGPSGGGAGVVSAVSTAQCAASARLVGGGAFTTVDGALQISRPTSTTSLGGAWEAQAIRVTGSAAFSVTAYALCAS